MATPLERHSSLDLPRPEQASLCWFVREAWPSPATGTALTEGTLGPEEGLLVVAESDLVLFGDGIESDSISIGWGQGVTFSIASRPLRLVVSKQRSSASASQQTANPKPS